MHDNESDRRRQTGCEPHEAWEAFAIRGKVVVENDLDDNSDETAEKVTEYQRPWLCERRVNSTVAKDGRRSLCSCQC